MRQCKCTQFTFQAKGRQRVVEKVYSLIFGSSYLYCRADFDPLHDAEVVMCLQAEEVDHRREQHDHHQHEAILEELLHIDVMGGIRLRSKNCLVRVNRKVYGKKLRWSNVFLTETVEIISFNKTDKWLSFLYLAKTVVLKQHFWCCHKTSGK